LRELALIEVFLVALGLVSVVGLPSVADANGGTLRLSRATAGPYLVSAWTRPDPPRVGRLDLSVAVMTPDSGQAVLGAEVRANAALTARQEVTTSTRLERGGGGNLLLYHGNVELPAAGAWRILIEADGPNGSGIAAFELDVRTPLPIAAPIAIGVVALSAGGALWWVRTRRRTRLS
jgi:hypothetical protein